MRRTHSIQIDRIACDGYGMCAELLPELITLDEWGYPIIHAAGVPGELVSHARLAIEACPVLAFKVRRDHEPRPDGRHHSSARRVRR